MRPGGCDRRRVPTSYPPPVPAEARPGGCSRASRERPQAALRESEAEGGVRTRTRVGRRSPRGPSGSACGRVRPEEHRGHSHTARPLAAPGSQAVSLPDSLARTISSSFAGRSSFGRALRGGASSVCLPVPPLRHLSIEARCIARASADRRAQLREIPMQACRWLHRRKERVYLARGKSRKFFPFARTGHHSMSRRGRSASLVRVGGMGITHSGEMPQRKRLRRPLSRIRPRAISRSTPGRTERRRRQRQNARRSLACMSATSSAGACCRPCSTQSAS